MPKSVTNHPTIKDFIDICNFKSIQFVETKLKNLGMSFFGKETYFFNYKKYLESKEEMTFSVSYGKDRKSFDALITFFSDDIKLDFIKELKSLGYYPFEDEIDGSKTDDLVIYFSPEKEKNNILVSLKSENTINVISKKQLRYQLIKITVSKPI